MNKLNFNPEYVQGPNKNDYNLDEMKKEGIIKSSRNLRNGEIACYYGHLNVLKKFLKSDNKYAPESPIYKSPFIFKAKIIDKTIIKFCKNCFSK